MGTGQWLKMQVTAGAERELQSMWCGWHLIASLDCKKRHINKHSALLTRHFAIYIFSHNLVHKKLPQTSSRATRCVSSKTISLWRLSGHQRTLEAIRLAEICFQPPLCPFDIITLHQPADWPRPSFCFSSSASLLPPSSPAGACHLKQWRLAADLFPPGVNGFWWQQWITQTPPLAVCPLMCINPPHPSCHHQQHFLLSSPSLRLSVCGVSVLLFCWAGSRQLFSE